jgi:hypothetical protein
MGHIGDELGGHLGRGQFVVHKPRGDGAARHAVVFGGLRVLGHNHAALALDGPHPQGAVAAGAREHHADGPLALVMGQRPEKEVDGQALAAWGRRLQQLQRAVQERHVAARRDDIGAIGLHLHAVLDLKDLHTRVSPDQVGQNALVIRGQVLHQHKGHTRVSVCGHAGEEGLKGRQTPGRSADAHNGKSGGGPVWLWLRVNGGAGVLRRHAGFRFTLVCAGQFGPVFFPLYHATLSHEKYLGNRRRLPVAGFRQEVSQCRQRMDMAICVSGKGDGGRSPKGQDATAPCR